MSFCIFYHKFVDVTLIGLLVKTNVVQINFVGVYEDQQSIMSLFCIIIYVQC